MKGVRMGKYIKVRQRKHSIGRLCMKCAKSATITAVYKTNNRLEMDVWYCNEHAIEGGLI